MKISMVGQAPIYVSKERGEMIKQQLMIGAEYFEIDGNTYKSSVITAITNESDPSQYGKDVDKKRLSAPEHKRASEDSPGYLKYKEARNKLLDSKSV